MPAPRTCTRTNIGAFVGSIPVKVSERVRHQAEDHQQEADGGHHLRQPQVAA